MNRIQPDLLRRFSPNERYLVGLSGGRDSVALLHWLVDSSYKKLICCHLNHQLRGRASDADARFVRKLADRCDVDLVIGSAKVRALASEQKLSIEAAAREARYKFFAQVAKRKRIRTIFLAHHADDVVETFLINLFRGAGSTGLSAMREVSNRRIDNVNLTIVRPFLGIWRTQIDDYVRKHRLKFREDASNRDVALLRNRIRRQIIPYLEKTVGRNIRPSIWRTATIAAEEENWIETQLPRETPAELSVLELRKLPTALQRREILKWLRLRKISSVGFDMVENIRTMLDPNSRIAKVNLPQDQHVRRRAKKVFITD
jgi:tRNA(Ile)-lysidine synthase